MLVTKRRGNTKWRTGPPNPRISDFVNFNLDAPCTHADVIRKIAEALQLRIESQPEQLRLTNFPRGRGVFGSAADELDNITANYQNLHWCISGKVLRFAVINNSGKSLSRFDDLAGRLMAEARPRRGASRRLDNSEYAKIAAELDKQHFRILDHLEHSARKNLASWNQTHPRKAIHTFMEALNGRLNRERFRRAVLRRFSRAEAKFISAKQPLLMRVS